MSRMQALSSNSDETPSVCTLALVGSPNSGKTTLFNGLTGSRYKVANYPGVTVERRFGRCNQRGCDQKGCDQAVELVDLPGIYSLSGVSPDELVATETILSTKETIDGVVLVLDATSLDRQLFLASQVIDLGYPTIVVLTMMDLAKNYGKQVKVELLARLLGVPVVAKGTGALQQLKEELRSFATKLPRPRSPLHSEWCSLPFFYDKACEIGYAELSLAPEARAQCLGLQILAGARRATVERAQLLVQELEQQLREQGLEARSFEAMCRFAWARKVVQASVVTTPVAENTWEYKIDGLVTHRFWGAVIFLGVLSGLFQVVFQLSAFPMEWVEWGIEFLSSQVAVVLGTGLLSSLLVDGMIMGVGNVVVFVPQIALLFFFLSLLEESGYLARAAHVMDRPMRVVGLQGRSFVPMLNSFACAIPGILSTRTIASFGDRLATIMVAPLMSCSARLPVYTVLISALIPATLLGGLISLQGVVLMGLYLLGILGAGTAALIFKKTLLRGEPAQFILELPRFRKPSLRTAFLASVDRSWDFIKSAGTIILACSIILWALASFPQGVSVEHSYAGQLGQAIEPVVEPLGYDWQISIAIVSSFVAREVFVTSLATVYNLEDSETQSQSLADLLRDRRKQGQFSMATGLSLLVFYVFACQCMSTLAVVKSETGSFFWPIVMFVYMSVLAYLGAWLTYKIAGGV